MRFTSLRPALAGALALSLAVTACADDGGGDDAAEPAAADPVDVVVETQSSPDIHVSTSGQHVGIETNGVGEIELEPDVADLRLGVSVLRAKAEDANAIAAEKAQIVFDVLAFGGIEMADVQTTNYRIDPRWERNRITAYRVTNNLTIRIRDLEKIGPLIDATTALVGDEIRIDGISFSLEDNTEAIEAARDLAMDDAVARAEQLAEAAGAELGGVVSIRESSPQNFAYDLRAADAVAAFADANRSVTQIAGGEVGTTVTVTVRWDVA